MTVLSLFSSIVKIEDLKHKDLCCCLFCRISDYSSNILLKGFTVEACRKHGIEAKKVENVVFSELKIQNLGKYCTRKCTYICRVSYLFQIMT